VETAARTKGIGRRVQFHSRAKQWSAGLCLWILIARWMGGSMALGDASGGGAERDVSAAAQYAGRTIDAVRVVATRR